MRFGAWLCTRQRRPDFSQRRRYTDQSLTESRIEAMEQRLLLSGTSGATADQLGIEPNPTPIGIAPLPTPYPRPVDAVDRVGIEPNPTPIGIAPLPTPHPRPAGAIGRVGLEPNPTPSPRGSSRGGQSSGFSESSDNSPAGMSSSAYIAGMSSSAIVRVPGIEPNPSPAPIDPSPLSHYRAFTDFDRLDDALQRTGRR